MNMKLAELKSFVEDNFEEKEIIRAIKKDINFTFSGIGEYQGSYEKHNSKDVLLLNTNNKVAKLFFEVLLPIVNACLQGKKLNEGNIEENFHKITKKVAWINKTRQYPYLTTHESYYFAVAQVICNKLSVLNAKMNVPVQQNTQEIVDDIVIDEAKIRKYFKLNEEITLSCVQGYQPRTIVEINDTYLVLQARIKRQRSYEHLTLLVNAMLENGFREITDSDEIRIFVTQKTGVPSVQGGNDRRAYYAMAIEYLKRSRQLPNVAQPQPRNSIANGLDAQAIVDDIENVPDDIQGTEREALIKIRIGQSKFRDGLIKYWDSKCSVTECVITRILIASHIKPWRDCIDDADAKLDVMNGLLLIPNLDALFDKGFISFDNNGQIIISPQLSNDDLKKLGVNKNMKLKKTPNEQRKAYLE